jgi:hypothetical protein
VVTARQADAGGARPTDWDDPYYVFGPEKDITRIAYTPTAGAATGSTFEIVYGPGVSTHAWGIAANAMITIGGDVTVADLKSALDSLK